MENFVKRGCRYRTLQTSELGLADASESQKKEVLEPTDFLLFWTGKGTLLLQARYGCRLCILGNDSKEILNLIGSPVIPCYINPQEVNWHQPCVFCFFWSALACNDVTNGTPWELLQNNLLDKFPWPRRTGKDWEMRDSPFWLVPFLCFHLQIKLLACLPTVRNSGERRRIHGNTGEYRGIQGNT